MTQDFHGSFQRTGERSFEGFARDPGDPARRFVVEILIDGDVVRTMLANAHVPALAADGADDGCCGFSFVIPEAWTFAMRLIEARVANLGWRIGAVLPLLIDFVPAPALLACGRVTWEGSDLLTGACASLELFPLALVTVGGDMLARVTQPMGWDRPGPGEHRRPWPAFTLRLPPELADGEVHRLRLLAANGEELSGSPLTLQVPLPLPPGMPAALQARLLPRSLPFADWRLLEGASAPAAARQPKVGVVFVGEAGIDGSVAALQRLDGVEWIAAVLEETGGPGCFSPDMLEEALTGDLAECDVVVVTLAGMELRSLALAEVLRQVRQGPPGGIVTADWVWRRPDGTEEPVLLARFDQERFLEQGYCAFLFAMDRSDLIACARAGARAGAPSLFHLFAHAARLADAAGAGGIRHCPGVLGSLAGRMPGACAPALAACATELLAHQGQTARLTLRDDLLLPALHVAREVKTASLTVILAAPAKIAELEATLASLEPTGAAGETEIAVVLAADSPLRDEMAGLARHHRGLRLVAAGPALNRARQMNAGARATAGALLCFIDPGCTAPPGDWASEMQGRLLPSSHGAVGSLLVHPSGLVLDGGRVLGPGFSAVPAFAASLADEAGYSGLLGVAHRVSALGEGCLMTSRATFEALGGFDEGQCTFHFAKPDFCLRLGAGGLASIVTPHVRFSRAAWPAPDGVAGQALSSPAAARQEIELRQFRNRWSGMLAQDPAYSPLLNRDRLPYTGLLMPVRTHAAATTLADPATAQSAAGARGWPNTQQDL